MAGEIQLNSTTLATESSGSITAEVDTIRPNTTNGSLTLQGDNSGTGVSGITIDSSGNVTLAGNLSAPNYVGMIAAFAMSSAPTGWLACDGSTVSRTTYADLFTAIGTTWGAGDGSSTFALPDLEGAFLRGIGSGSIDSRTKTGPTNVGDFQEDAVLDHRHSLNGANGVDPSLKFSSSSAEYPFITYQQGAYQRQIGSMAISTTNGSSYMNTSYRTDGNQNIVYNAGVKYCIKY